MTMADSIPQKSSNSELFIRDHLAGYRTELASRRTLLAYIRTCLSMVAAGLVFIRFWEHPSVVALGWVLLPVSGLILVHGIRSYARVQKIIQSEEKSTGESNGPFTKPRGNRP